MSHSLESAPRLRGLTETEQSAKRTLMGLLEQDRMRLLTRQPFIASLAMRMDLVPAVDYRLPTAATDGERLFFNPLFMLDLNENERLFVMAHEVWHCAALHFPRRREREFERWNIAIDHEVNNLLQEQGLTLVEGAILFTEWRGLNAEEVYERLPEQEDLLPDRGECADIHDPAIEAGQPVEEGIASAKDDADEEASSLPVDQDFCPGGSDRIWQSWPRRVHAAAQQTYRDLGRRPGWLKRILELHGKPELSWKELLRRFVDRVRTDHYRWTEPNRRFIGQGIILPGRSGERLEVAVALDVSGSTIGDMPRFLAELNGILKSYGRFNVRLMACDTEITFDETFSDDRPLPEELLLGGGGGTNLRPVFERLHKQRPKALIFLTDGYAEVPEHAPGFPVAWCLPFNGRVPTDWGEVVKLN